MCVAILYNFAWLLLVFSCIACFLNMLLTEFFIPILILKFPIVLVCMFVFKYNIAYFTVYHLELFDFATYFSSTIKAVPFLPCLIPLNNYPSLRFPYLQKGHWNFPNSFST